MVSKEKEEENISTVEKTEEEKIDEADIPDKISEDSSDAKKTSKMCLEKEEVREHEDAKKDEIATAQALQVEEPNEQSLTSAMPDENIEHGTTANEEEEKRPQEPEAVVDQETAQASITEESLEIETIGTVKKLEEEKRKEAEKLENENCEDSSGRETEEICLQKEEPNEPHAVPKEEITSDQTFSGEQLHISTSAITSEERKHETKKTEDEKTNEGEIIKDKIEEASDETTTVEICSQKERSVELEAVAEDELTVGHTLTEKKSSEQAQNPTSALPSKEEECGSTNNGEDASLQKERLQEDETLAVVDNASAQTIPTEKPEEQISNPVVTLPSTEEEKVKEEEMQNGDSDGVTAVQEISSEKIESKEPRDMLEGETNPSQVVAEESQEHGTVREEEKIKEAETKEDDKTQQSECTRELQGALEDGATAAFTLPVEKPEDHLHITTSTLPSEVQGDESKETELQEDESPEKIPEQTRETEEAQNFNTETHERAFDNELLNETEDAAIKEKPVRARDETVGEENQCEKTNEGNEIIPNEVSKEEVMEDKEVTETSYSTSHSEEMTKDGSGEDEQREKLIEDKTSEEFIVEAQKTSENKIIEKQIEDKTVEDPGQGSVARIETTTVTEQGSSTELSVAEGNQIIDDIQQPEETTNIASDQQIPRELDPIENTEITSSIAKEHVPVDLQDRVAESSQKAEVGDVKEIYPEVVEHGREKTTDNSGEEITKQSTSVEDSTKVSSSDHVESSIKETLQVTQDKIKEREAKDETNASQILRLEEKPEEQSPAPSSKLPSAEGEHGVTTQVDVVEEKELKEVETLDKDSSDTKKGGEICLEKEENKELKAVVEQETIAEDAKKEETIVKDNTSSPKTLPEEKLEEQLQTSADRLPSEDEEVRTAHPIEKIEEEIQKDAEIKHGSLEDSSDTKTIEEVCSPNEEKKEAKAVSKEETIADQGLQNDEPEEQIQTTSSTLPSEEREHGTGAISEEIEYGKKKEEVLTEQDVVPGHEITGEQTLPANKPEQGTTSSPLVSKEKEEENISTVEKTEEEKTNEADIQDKISEDSSDAKKTAKICLEKEEFQELEDAKKDEIATAQALQVEEPNELSLTSALPAENIEHGTTANEEEEEEKVKEVVLLGKETCLEKGGLQEPEAVVDQETIVAQASIIEESLEIEAIGTVEKQEEEKRKEAEKLEDENCEDSSARETEEICLQKEEPNEPPAVPKEEITSGQTFSEEPLHISTSATTSEELEHETKKTEDEKTNKGEIIKDKIEEEASDARTTVEICSQKERSVKSGAVVEDELTAGHTLPEKKSEEQVQNPSSPLPSTEEKCGSTSTAEKIESDKTEEAEFLQDANGENASLQKEQLQEDEALAVVDNTSAQIIPTEKPEEQIPNPVVILPSEEHKHETINGVDKTEEEKLKEEEMRNGDSDVGKTVQEICSEKNELKEPRDVLEGETNPSQVIAEESREHGTVREEKRIKEAEILEDDKTPQSEYAGELQGALEDRATAAHTLPGEKPEDHLHITTSKLPSEVQGDETKETELQEDESPETIPEQTREIEEAQNFNKETHERAFDIELLTETEDAAIKEKLVKARDETVGEENQCEKTNEGNEIIPNEVSKEEVMVDKEVTETSYSTSHSEELTKDGSGEDEQRDKLIEDKKSEEFNVEAQKTSENEIIEKQREDKIVEDPGQGSVASIETATVTEQGSSTDFSVAEGNQIIDDIQQPEVTTNIASDQQIPRELDPIENTENTSSTAKEHVPIDLKDRVAESSQNAEVGDVKEIYPEVVEHGGEKTTDNSAEEITKESTSVDDLTKISSSDHVESSIKETLQVTHDMIVEREEKVEINASKILLGEEKPEEQSPAPSSKLPSVEGEQRVTTQVDVVEEKELKEVEALDKCSSDTKTGGEICVEKEENKELVAVVEQETIAVQAPSTKIKEDPVSHFEDGSKEDELKDEHTGDKTNETLKIQTYEIQNEKLSMETLKDSANNIKKEIVAEDETVKDLEQVPVEMEEATIVREQIPGEEESTESRNKSSSGKEHFPTEQQVRALEISDKAEARDLEPGNTQEICSEAGVDPVKEKKTDNSGVEITQEPESADSAKLSLSDLLQRSTREKIQVTKNVIEEMELTVSKEEPPVEEAEAIQAKEAKTDEEKDEGEEGDEHNKADSGSDAPVMVEAPRDTNTKPRKKSHNILSGVGSKVKQSISKVKKAIIGKSSHSKESKPKSPKESEK
ncbi:trichohyalin-like [Durio zibethinus]|uniref:Trichohyalin-like n=1 Tax=Durio zibethinus TaxID=66656 RepID=A0A6P5YN05_DURZI|nr:trichohyalin-like [Durio zibethinus]